VASAKTANDFGFAVFVQRSIHRVDHFQKCRSGMLWRYVFFSVCIISAVTVDAFADEKPDPKAAEKNPATKLDPTKVAFFEKHVRPLLLDQCIDCHSGDDPESELSLDSRAGMLRGGLRGSSLIPNMPEKSLLIRAVRHGELVKMPPKRKLPATDIAKLAKWIKDGAVWPNSKDVAVKKRRIPAVKFTEEEKSFWAFQPVVRPNLPNVTRRDWVQSPIDPFILSQLEKAGVAPTSKATRRELLRRITFDLIGLPPKPDDVRRFLANASPDALDRVIERLLASPHYGERWGRHWLDVARYADSNGLDENLCYGNAYRYRDYVIDAFNSGKPFDRFVQEQIAGDLLESDGTPNNEFDRIVATGFLCIGPKMLAEDDPTKMHMDIIDEQLDTLTRALMGLTFGCARCHDHKFDPIPTADYYALAGILKSTHTMDTLTVVAKWHERPLETPEAIAGAKAIRDKIAVVAAKQKQLIDDANKKLVANAKQHIGDYLLAAERTNRLQADLSHLKPIGNQKVYPTGSILREAESFERGNAGKDTTNYGVGIGIIVNIGPKPNFAEYDIVVSEARSYRLEMRLAAADSRPCKLTVNGQLIRADVAKAVTGTWFPDTQKWFAESFVTLKKGKNTLRIENSLYFPHIDKLLLIPEEMAQAKPIELKPLSAYFQPVEAYLLGWQKVLKSIGDNSSATLKLWKKSSEKSDAAALRSLAMMIESKSTRQEKRITDAEFDKLVADAAGPFKTDGTTSKSFSKPTQEALAMLMKEQAQLTKSIPSMPQAMAVKEGKPENIRIHFRGNHLTQGVAVPRQFPQILSRGERIPITDKVSGRREFAEWMTQRQHPLTARVFVNRIWQWHFGAALVRTPDNFGRLGERPTHPQLLDWLADEFVRSGWSIKHLHRVILSSATYQQSVHRADDLIAKDPANELWGRMNRRRLEAEAIRDSLLQLSGKMDYRMRGTMLTIPNRNYVTSTANVNPKVYDTDRRSVYLPVVRSALFEVLQAFDFADPSVINGARQTTTVAPQALFIMNSQFVADQSKAMAETVLNDQADDDARITSLYWAVLSRNPTPSEKARTHKFIKLYVGRWTTTFPDRAVEAPVRAWQAISRSLIGSNEFVFRN
jgi:hypothetical protein